MKKGEVIENIGVSKNGANYLEKNQRLGLYGENDDFPRNFSDKS